MLKVFGLAVLLCGVACMAIAGLAAVRRWSSTTKPGMWDTTDCNGDGPCKAPKLFVFRNYDVGNEERRTNGR